MSSVPQEPRRWNWLKSQANGGRSIENVTMAESQDTKAGQVLGIVTAGGEHAAWDPSASDGTEDAVAILAIGTVTGVGETMPVAVGARDLEYFKDTLVVPDAATPTEVTNAKAQLAALGMIER